MHNIMNRTDVWILAILLEQQADSFIVAMSVDELIEAGAEGVARITLYKHLKKLVQNGFVGAGAKADRASSYFITDKGKALLNIEGRDEID